jgi:hypothetical protein
LLKKIQIIILNSDLFLLIILIELIEMNQNIPPEQKNKPPHSKVPLESSVLADRRKRKNAMNAAFIYN